MKGTRTGIFKTMRAVLFEVCGPPEVLKLKDDVPMPKLSAGRVLVAIKAAGAVLHTGSQYVCDMAPWHVF